MAVNRPNRDEQVGYCNSEQSLKNNYRASGQ